MKTLVFVLISLLTPAFVLGQEKMDPIRAEQAWRTIDSIAPLFSGAQNEKGRPAVRKMESPIGPITTGAVLVTESEPNGGFQKVTFLANQPGEYILRGVTWNGDSIRIAAINWGAPIDPTGFSTGITFDEAAYYKAMPYAQSVCWVELFRMGGGVKRMATQVSSCDPESPRIGPNFSIAGESAGDRYSVNLSGSGLIGASVAVGRYGMGEIQGKFGDKFIAIFPQSLGLQGVGPTSLTVCQEGVCRTQTYERQVTVGKQGPLDGKG